MCDSASNGEFYPGQNLSVSQLLHAARRKLPDSIVCRRYVWAVAFDTYEIILTRAQQDHDDGEPGRGGTEPRNCLNVCTMADVLPRSQVDLPEQDAMDVLRVVRSIKNTFVPIGRVPPEVLSLTPDYYELMTDDDLIDLTHVCRRRRDALVSRASMWTRLECVYLDKTGVYIQHSRGPPWRSPSPWSHSNTDAIPVTTRFF